MGLAFAEGELFSEALPFLRWDAIALLFRRIDPAGSLMSSWGFNGK